MLCMSLNMCTFAPAKVVVALAISYQGTEKEQFNLQGEGSGLYLFVRVYKDGGGKMTLKTKVTKRIYNSFI